jgi:hypothetical protein
MASSGMLRRVARVRTDVSEEHNASIIRIARLGSPILITLMMEAILFYEMSVPPKTTWQHPR